MKKIKHLSISTIILVLLFFSETNAFADVPTNPVATKGGVLLILGLIVVLIALFAWLIIRATKK